MNDREWAARWVGWEYTDGNAYAPDRGGAFDMSNTDADLAEAVRTSLHQRYMGNTTPELCTVFNEWGWRTPVENIAAAREVVE